MIGVPLPPDEKARLAALRSYEILETPPESEYDDLARLASLICGTSMALVSLVDEDRQWFKSRVGIEVTETPREVAFCAYAILGTDLFVVPDATRDERFAGNPLVVSGPQVRFYAGVPLLTEDGHALGTLCTMDQTPRELTEVQKEALAILGRQAAAHFHLRKVFVELRKLEALRDSLVHMIVHDLRQPLQSLLGGLETLRLLGALNVDQEEFLSMSLDGGRTLLGMINTLLDIHKLESGSLELEYSPAAPETLIDEGLGSVRQLAVEKELTLEATVEPELPPIQGDRDKLRRTLVNLIGNAVKFTPQGGKVTVSARRGDTAGLVLFSVADTGEGIPREAFTRIFEKFGQVERPNGAQRSSTGLGLAFCRLVVEAHGGSIWLESELGRGTVFYFTIPEAAPDPAQVATSVAESESG